MAQNSYTIASLVTDIKVALDYNNSSIPLEMEGDIDTLTLEELIESKIEDAARAVVERAPLRLVDEVEQMTTSNITWDSEDANRLRGGSITLDPDFLRLVSFKAGDWDYAVSEAIDDSSPLYARQHSRYGGVRGNPQQPVVAIVNRGSNLILEFFTTKSTTAEGSYIKIPKEDNGSISLSDKLKPAVVYYAAYMTARSVGNDNLAASMLNQANVLAGLDQAIPQQPQPQEE